MLLRSCAAATAAACLLAVGCVRPPPPVSGPPLPSGDILRADLDPAIAPGKDFFAYDNGGWLARNPIPPSEAFWGIGQVVDAELDEELRAINERAAAGAFPAGSDERRIGDFWRTAMDAAKSDALGAEPLRAELERIDAVSDRAGVVDAAFELRAHGVEALFQVEVSQDEKDSEVQSLHVSQGGLGLPDRDYYFSTEAGVARMRDEYPGHVARLLALLGRPAEDARRADAPQRRRARVDLVMDGRAHLAWRRVFAAGAAP